MTRLNWTSLDRPYESGVDRGVFYPANGPGVPWNGLVSVSESPSGSDIRVRYVDGVKYQEHVSSGNYEATIEAYTYPDEFEPFASATPGLRFRQRQKPFGLSYRTETEKGHKIHIVYNALAGPSDKAYVQKDPSNFSWEVSTTPLSVPGAAPTAHLVIDTSTAYPSTVSALEAQLYGGEVMSALLPSPAQVLDIFEENSLLRIVDNGDGTWTATGPDEAIQMLNPTTFEITWPSAIYISEDRYQISSL